MTNIKTKTKTNKQALSTANKKQTSIWIFYIIIAITCICLYGQSINNDFNIDDDYVYENHNLVQKGIQGIPEIFTARYNTKDGFYFGYRPITIALCAIEYELFGQNPKTAHAISIIYYIICCSLVFYFLCFLLKNTYKDNYYWIAFLISLIFATHAIHTEVALSIKNREEILALIFALTSTIFALKFFDSKKIIQIVISIFLLCIAFLTKESAIVFLVIIPFSVIFFKTNFRFLPDLEINTKNLFSLNKLLDLAPLIWLLLYIITINGFSFAGHYYVIHSYKFALSHSIILSGFFIHFLIILLLKIFKQKTFSFNRKVIILYSIALISLIFRLFYSNYLSFIIILICLYISLKDNNKTTKQISIRWFDNINKKILFSILGGIAVGSIALLIVYYLPQQSLPESNAPVFKWQNPMFDYSKSIFEKIAIAIYSFGYYLKLLLIPFPLRFYYGYKMIPDVQLYNPLVLISLAIHIYFIYYALKNFNKRDMIAFGIFFYFFSIFPFSNTFFPLTGIIAERMLFTPSLGFSIAIVFLFAKLLKYKPLVQFNKTQKYTLLAFCMILIFPNSIISIKRNPDWKNRETLLIADIKYLSNSAKANNVYANHLLGKILNSIKQNKPLKDGQQTLELAIKHFKRAIDIDSTYSNPYHSMGYISMIIFKDYKTADYYYSKCLSIDTTIAAAFLNRGITNYYLKDYNKSITDLDHYLSHNNNYIDKDLDKACVFRAKSYFELKDTAKANELYLEALNNLKVANLNPQVIQDIKDFFITIKNYENAIKVSDLEISLNSNDDKPYVEKGNFYLLQGDSINAIKNWEIAFEKYNGNFNIATTLYQYFMRHNEVDKANYYYNKAIKFKNENLKQQ